MSNFYDEWLNLEAKGVEERKKARKVIHAKDLQWIRTRQDYKAALLVSEETGFKTLGGVTMLAEIPVAWKTGKHLHGEEAMYVIKGKGFSIIDEQRFDWEEGSCLAIPFGAAHQHFNTGDTPIEYFSALAPHLEFFCMVSRFQQFEDCGEAPVQPNQPESVSDFNSEGRRIVLHRKDAKHLQRGDPDGRPQDAFMKSHPDQMRKGQHGKLIKMMGVESFRSEEAEITDIFFDGPRSIGQKHAHMEALLYILDGEGYSIVDEEKIPWSKGSALDIQGPQTVHQHVVTSDIQSQMLRTHFGIRKYMQPIAKKTFPYLYLEEGRPL